MSRSISQLTAKLGSFLSYTTWKHFPLILTRYNPRTERKGIPEVVRARRHFVKVSLCEFQGRETACSRAPHASRRCVTYIWKALTRHSENPTAPTKCRSLKFHRKPFAPRKHRASALWVPRVSSCRSSPRVMTCPYTRASV